MHKYDACLFVKQGLIKMFLPRLHFHTNSEAAKHYHSHLGALFSKAYSANWRWFMMNL